MASRPLGHSRYAVEALKHCHDSEVASALFRSAAEDSSLFDCDPKKLPVSLNTDVVRWARRKSVGVTAWAVENAGTADGLDAHIGDTRKAVREAMAANPNCSPRAQRWLLQRGLDQAAQGDDTIVNTQARVGHPRQIIVELNATGPPHGHGGWPLTPVTATYFARREDLTFDDLVDLAEPGVDFGADGAGITPRLVIAGIAAARLTHSGHRDVVAHHWAPLAQITSGRESTRHRHLWVLGHSYLTELDTVDVDDLALFAGLFGLSVDTQLLDIIDMLESRQTNRHRTLVLAPQLLELCLNELNDIVTTRSTDHDAVCQGHKVLEALMGMIAPVDTLRVSQQRRLGQTIMNLQVVAEQLQPPVCRGDNLVRPYVMLLILAERLSDTTMAHHGFQWLVAAHDQARNGASWKYALMRLLVIHVPPTEHDPIEIYRWCMSLHRLVDPDVMAAVLERLTRADGVTGFDLVEPMLSTFDADYFHRCGETLLSNLSPFSMERIIDQIPWLELDTSQTELVCAMLGSIRVGDMSRPPAQIVMRLAQRRFGDRSDLILSAIQMAISGFGGTANELLDVVELITAQPELV